jgi:hypothetical protein
LNYILSTGRRIIIMNPIWSWSIFLGLAGAFYWYYFVYKNPGGQARGRPLQRGANAIAAKIPVQWDDEDTKSKPTAKANKTKPRKSVKTAVKEVGNKVEASLPAALTNAVAEASEAVTSTLAKAPSGRDVSDMLEANAPKSILKISGSEKPARPAKPQQQHSETTETKKQRQNKKKTEDAKAAREAAEEERKKLLEQQRRTAREARGEPARNGLQTAQAPASSPWNRAAAPAVQAAPVGGQLLDTIDNVSTVSSSSATNGTAPTPDSTSYANLPSEEDQLRMAMEESVWTTVPKGRKKTKNAVEETDSGAQQQETAPAVKPAPVKPAPKKVENVKPASRFDVLSERLPEVLDPRDSDWPVV